MGRRVPRLWVFPTQGLRDTGAPRSPEALGADPLAPPLFRSSTRSRLLVQRRYAIVPAHLLAVAQFLSGPRILRLATRVLICHGDNCLLTHRCTCVDSPIPRL